MNIYYDGGIYGFHGTGGISRYFSNLIKRLPESFSPTLTSIQSAQEDYPNHPNLKLYTYPRFGFRPGKLSFWLEKYYFRATSHLAKMQLAHPTYYSLLTRQDLSHYRCPIVITVYDMIHEIFADTVDKNGLIAETKRRAILEAQAIICISQSTKRDLLEYYKISEQKVIVTHLASEFKLQDNRTFEPLASQPFFLYVGNRGSYKNFDCLLVALSKLVSLQPDVLLYVLGGGEFTSNEKKLIANLCLDKHVCHCGYISDIDLARYYQQSVALVYPSLYEGFGIPPLEAMSCGTAVIASNVSSIPEVVGDAGLLFDPTSENQLADRMLFLLENSIERDRLIQEGAKRVKLFSWDRMTKQTVDLYQSLIA